MSNMLDWNEFNKELQNRVSDPALRYILGMMYERILDLAKQQDEAADVLLSLAGTVQGMMGLSEMMDSKLEHLKKMMQGDTDGVDVRSVPLINEDR